jgi:uncharacterized protein YciI
LIDMLYAIIAVDGPNSLPIRAKTRPSHLAYVRQLLDSGRLAIAGPHPAIDCADPGDAGFSGSLIIAEFESLDAAKEWARSDPYAIAGVFQNVTIKPFVQVLP